MPHNLQQKDIKTVMFLPFFDILFLLFFLSDLLLKNKYYVVQLLYYIITEICHWYRLVCKLSHDFLFLDNWTIIDEY